MLAAHSKKNFNCSLDLVAQLPKCKWCNVKRVNTLYRHTTSYTSIKKWKWKCYNFMLISSYWIINVTRFYFVRIIKIVFNFCIIWKNQADQPYNLRSKSTFVPSTNFWSQSTFDSYESEFKYQLGLCRYFLYVSHFFG